MQASGMFVRVEVDEPTASNHDAAKQLSQVCPVDIYAVGQGDRVDLVDENIDECILCGLCLDVGEAGTVRVYKLYEDGDGMLGK
jgi:ferredoxin-like protein FixX